MNCTTATRIFPDNEIKPTSFSEAQKVIEIVIFIYFGDKLFTDEGENFCIRLLGERFCVGI